MGSLHPVAVAKLETGLDWKSWWFLGCEANLPASFLPETLFMGQQWHQLHMGLEGGERQFWRQGILLCIQISISCCLLIPSIGLMIENQGGASLLLVKQINAFNSLKNINEKGNNLLLGYLSGVLDMIEKIVIQNSLSSLLTFSLTLAKIVVKSQSHYDHSFWWTICSYNLSCKVIKSAIVVGEKLVPLKFKSIFYSLW